MRVADLKLRKRTQNCLRAAGVSTVTELVAMTETELLAIPHFGVTSLDDVRVTLGGLGLFLADHPHASGGDAVVNLHVDGAGSDEVAVTEVLGALMDLAAWGTARGLATVEDLLTAFGSNSPDPLFPRAAAETLAGARLAEIAGDRAAIFDWRRQLQLHLDALDDRSRSILLERVALGGPTATLEEFGERLSISRERVRQLEMRAVEAFGSDGTDRAVTAACMELASVVGTCATVGKLITAGFDIDQPPERLLVGLAIRAGHLPSARVEEQLGMRWLVAGPSPAGLVLNVFDEMAEGGVVTDPNKLQAVVRSRLRALTTDEAETEVILDRALGQCEDVREVNGKLVRWTGSYPDKAERVLRAFNRPLTKEELTEWVTPGNERGVVNQIQSATQTHRFVRTQNGEYGLPEWDDIEPYQSLLDVMRSAIIEHGGRIGIRRLKRQLFRTNFKASSIVMYATMHPDFVCEDDVVRLRANDEPIFMRDITREAGCYRVVSGGRAGCWSWITTVDYDRLYRSSLLIPHAFGNLLGISYGEEAVNLRCGERIVRASWKDMKPILWSSGNGIKAILQERGAHDGDQLMLIAVAPGEIDIQVRPSLADDATPLERIAALIGVDALGDAEELVVSLGRSLGLESHDVSSTEILRAIEDRNDRSLRSLFLDAFPELAGGEA